MNEGLSVERSTIMTGVEYRSYADEALKQMEKAKSPKVKKGFGVTLLVIGIPAAVIAIVAIGLIIAAKTNSNFPDFGVVLGDAGFSIGGHAFTVIEASALFSGTIGFITITGGSILIHFSKKDAARRRNSLLEKLTDKYTELGKDNSVQKKNLEEGTKNLFLKEKQQKNPNIDKSQENQQLQNPFVTS